MPLHEEVHSGRYCNVEWPIRESLVQNCGSFGLEQWRIRIGTCGEAATEGMGLQSILNDFCLCGHVAIKSDATAAIGMVHRLGLGKVRHLAGRLVGATSRLPKCPDQSERCTPSFSDQNHCCVTRKRPIGFLLLMMTNRDECRWVVLC